MLKVLMSSEIKGFTRFSFLTCRHAYLIERDRLRQENFVDFNGK